MNKAEKTVENRDRVIVRTSILGVAANVLLAAVKAVIGLLANSIAVILDAVNNLSDALSSVITIVGTKLAGKKPDKKHPLGYGRIEYFSAMLVAAIVLYAGITSFVESFKKILHPETPDYSTLSLVIIALAVLVKLALGSYVKRTGKKVRSGSLIASGSDALFDAVLSGSVLLCAVAYLLWGVRVEAYVGLIIAAFIIKSGLEMFLETVDELLGKRVERSYLNELKKTICEDEQVLGAFDLILHNYGPDRYIGSVHVEVPDTLNASQIDAMQRRIAENVLQKHGVFLTGIGIYSQDTQNEAVKALRSEITRKIMEYDGVLQVHGFYADLDKKTIQLDVILDYALDNRGQLFSRICEKVQADYPDFTLRMTMDADV